MLRKGLFSAKSSSRTRTPAHTPRRQLSSQTIENSTGPELPGAPKKALQKLYIKNVYTPIPPHMTKFHKPYNAFFKEISTGVLNDKYEETHLKNLIKAFKYPELLDSSSLYEFLPHADSAAFFQELNTLFTNGALVSHDAELSIDSAKHFFQLEALIEFCNKDSSYIPQRGNIEKKILKEFFLCYLTLPLDGDTAPIHQHFKQLLHKYFTTPLSIKAEQSSDNHIRNNLKELMLLNKTYLETRANENTDVPKELQDSASCTEPTSNIALTSPNNSL